MAQKRQRLLILQDWKNLQRQPRMVHSGGRVCATQQDIVTVGIILRLLRIAYSWASISSNLYASILVKDTVFII